MKSTPALSRHDFVVKCGDEIKSEESESISQTNFSFSTLCWNEALWLDVASLVTSLNQLRCFVTTQHGYTMLKFVYDVDFCSKPTDTNTHQSSILFLTQEHYSRIHHNHNQAIHDFLIIQNNAYSHVYAHDDVNSTEQDFMTRQAVIAADIDTVSVHAFLVSAIQCDQIGRFSGLWTTF